MGMLRLALALAVLLTHLPLATFKFIGGGLAVQGFFIVSGFYMALVLDGKYRDRALFYSNRLLRLLPAYFVMMLICAIALFGYGVSATASPDLFAQVYTNPFAAVVMGLENLGLLGQELLYWFRIDGEGFSFDASGATPTETASVAWQALLVPQSWSLSMELQFYLLAPLLAQLSWRRLLLIGIASAALRYAGHWLPVGYGIWQGRLFPTSIFLFVLGMLAHRALPRAAAAPLPLQWAITAATLALVVCGPMLHLPDEAARALVYLAIAAATPFIFSAFKHNAVDRWLGDLSYPIYLSHLLVVALVLQLEPPQPVWVALGGTLALSALLLMLVDRPVDRWRQLRAQRMHPSAA